MERISPQIVGIFNGSSKPKSVNAFLLNIVLQRGIQTNNRKIQVALRWFICDTPARAMLRGVIGHNAYASCLKYTTDGEYSHAFGKMIFLELDAPLRNDLVFRSKIDEGHHKTTSVLEDIDGLDMIKDFPIGDALHLIDLGIMKSFLIEWKTGTLNNTNAKWSAFQAQQISDYMTSCKMPVEIR
ncbi:uncharacterized protein LOC131683326 isoform X1 [Topomyia yanbarensis]|uniref:uncharacterized protein LOC131683326 isoform X1 n=1 Tax=Topomyia yanbarensis TaxID=2498891 RepID=UPI00273BDAE7|nr:uncharacterized protein LOC131683326 isoform X1 [Topomyia yanbarensis]